jgi:hypothetical protein
MRIYPILAIMAGLLTSPASAADAPPPDDVTCIGKALSAEDREIALVMFAESTRFDRKTDEPQTDAGVDASEAPPFMSEHMAEVFELLEESHMRCLDLYPWNSGQSEASRYHAFLNIVGDAIAKTLKLEDMDIAALDGFYDANKKKMVHRNRLNAAEQAALTTHLAAASWKTEDIELLKISADYVETLMTRDMLRRAFDTGDFTKLERL